VCGSTIGALGDTHQLPSENWVVLTTVLSESSMATDINTTKHYEPSLGEVESRLAIMERGVESLLNSDPNAHYH
jgi:hypothetical protein